MLILFSEQVYCRDTDQGYEVNINLLNAPSTTNTAVQFMKQITPTKTASTDPKCLKVVTLISGTTNKYRATVTEKTAATCDWTFDATVSVLLLIQNLLSLFFKAVIYGVL